LVFILPIDRFKTFLSISTLDAVVSNDVGLHVTVAVGVAKYSDVGHVEGYILETVQDVASITITD